MQLQGKDIQILYQTDTYVHMYAYTCKINTGHNIIVFVDRKYIQGTQLLVDILALYIAYFIHDVHI